MKGIEQEPANFFNFNPFKINILLLTALKKLLHLTASFVVPAWLA
jgi:hypothetical protein